MLAFVEWYRARVRPSTVERRFASIKAYYSYLVGTGQRRDHPCDGIRLKASPRSPKQPFTLAELRQLYAACRRQQDRAVVLLWVDCGLRLSEMVSVRRDHLDVAQGTLRVYGKGNKVRVAALSSTTLAALAICMDGREYPWYSQRLHGPMTRDGLYRLCRRLGARTGLHVFPRRFRTSFACQFLEQTGGDVDAAQVLMGHSRLETTLGYSSWIRLDRALAQQRSLALGDRIA